MELAIDTSTAIGGAALSHEGETLTESALRAAFNHTVELMPAIERLLKQRNVKARDLDAVIVAIGPGGFSGLRVGVSAAKGLAMSLGIPLAGVSTLAVEAQQFVDRGLPIRPVLDAGRGELAAGWFRPSEGGLAEEAPPRIATVEELCASVEEQTLFCGEGLAEARAAISERLGPLAVFPPRSASPRRPRCLAELGWRRLALGESDDPATLQPVYLRGPSITRPRPARAAKR